MTAEDLGSCERVTFQCRDRGNFIGDGSEGPRMGGWRGRGAHSQTSRPLLLPLGLAGSLAALTRGPKHATCPIHPLPPFANRASPGMCSHTARDGRDTCSPMRGFPSFVTLLLATISDVFRPAGPSDSPRHPTTAIATAQIGVPMDVYRPVLVGQHADLRKGADAHKSTPPAARHDLAPATQRQTLTDPEYDYKYIRYEGTCTLHRKGPWTRPLVQSSTNPSNPQLLSARV